MLKHLSLIVPWNNLKQLMVIRLVYSHTHYPVGKASLFFPHSVPRRSKFTVQRTSRHWADVKPLTTFSPTGLFCSESFYSWWKLASLIFGIISKLPDMNSLLSWINLWNTFTWSLIPLSFTLWAQLKGRHCKIHPISLEKTDRLVKVV